jgi:hypothetical protein
MKKNNDEYKPTVREWTQVTLSQIMHEMDQCSPLFIARY